MAFKSTPRRYGSVAVTIHWLTALAIFALLGTGLAASNATDAAREAGLLRAHAIMGIFVGVLTLFRIAWWLAFDNRPPDETTHSSAQKLAARAVHYGLYGVMLVMVASGMGTLITTGANGQIFGGVPLPLPDFTLAPPFTVHGVVARLLIALVIGHVGAALWHQFIRRDRLLARMGLGR